MSFYMDYMVRWPEYFEAAESASGDIMGYAIGKAEGRGDKHHGHVSAVTVSPEYRRIGIAALLMRNLETTSDVVYKTNYVDLFVRASNDVAINMYKKFGYSVYQRVLGYYSAGVGHRKEDGLDMRKAMSRDVNKLSIIPRSHPVKPSDLEFN